MRGKETPPKRIYSTGNIFFFSMDIFTPPDLTIGFTQRAAAKIPQPFTRGYSQGISSPGRREKKKRKQKRNNTSLKVSFGNIWCQ